MSSIQTLPIAAAVLSQIIQGGSSGLGSTMPLQQPQEGPPPAGSQTQFTPGDQMVQHAAMAVPGVPGYADGGQVSDSTEYHPLNFKKLLDSGAVRITHRGNSDGGYSQNPEDGFSVVTGWNADNGTSTQTWPDNPGAYGVAEKVFRDNPSSLLDYKYKQIMDSARKRGLKDEDIFAPSYAAGGIASLNGTPGGAVRGPGDGMSDDVPAVIDGKEPARIASDEFVVPADVVSDLGNGSSEAGHRRLYTMMDNVRKARHGTKKQPPQVKQGLASLMRPK